MTNELIKVDPKEFGLEETKANELTVGLKTILKERNVLIDAYNDVITLEITEQTLPTFRELRLQIRDNRTKGIEKWHKVNKEFFLTGGRFVDAIKNKEIAENERMESKLLDAEKHFENIENERLKAVHNERVQKLVPYGYEIGATDFGAMDENMFNAILIGAEKSHNDKIELTRKQEEERLEALRIEAEQKEAQRLEMERLRKENEEKEKQLQAEREQAAKEQAELKAKAELEAKQQAEILAKQKAESDRLAAELKAKSDAEEKIKADQLAREKLEKEEAKRLAKAPDKEKLTKWIDSLMIGITPNVGGDGHKLALDIHVKFEGFKKWATEQINNL